MSKVVMVGSIALSLLNFRRELMESLIARGHEVVACAHGADREIIQQLQGMGITYEEIPFARTSLNPFLDLKALLTLVRVFRYHRPDLAILYTIKPVLYGSLSAFITRVPNVSSIITGLGYTFSDGSVAKRVLTYAIRWLYRISFRYNRVVFFQNVDDKELFEKFKILRDGHVPVLINGSGVNTEQFNYNVPPTMVSFLMISRLLSEKGVREYVAAAQVLKQKYRDVSFKLVGFIDSNPRAIGQAELQKWVDEGVVDYLGRLSDVRNAIVDSAVFVLPSYYREGVPRSILEALSIGRPVITTDTPGCRDTVVDGVNGYLVKPRDVSGLVNAMETFIVNPALIPQMGSASRDMAVSKYDVKQVNHVILSSLQLA